MDGAFEGASERADRTSHQSRGRGRGLRRRRKFLITISTAVVSAAAVPFFGVVFVSRPQVPATTAQEFFDNYYRQATQADLRKALYHEDLTPAFRESLD